MAAHTRYAELSTVPAFGGRSLKPAKGFGLNHLEVLAEKGGVRSLQVPKHGRGCERTTE